MCSFCNMYYLEKKNIQLVCVKSIGRGALSEIQIYRISLVLFEERIVITPPVNTYQTT